MRFLDHALFLWRVGRCDLSFELGGRARFLFLNHFRLSIDTLVSARPAVRLGPDAIDRPLSGHLHRHIAMHHQLDVWNREGRILARVRDLDAVVVALLRYSALYDRAW